VIAHCGPIDRGQTDRHVRARCAVPRPVARRAAHDEKLPPEISWRWTLTNSMAIFNEPLSIAFDGSRGPETVSGRLAWRGIMCGAKDEPIQAQ
jgi:hypothetical protein